jgi:hypothetical protein
MAMNEFDEWADSAWTEWAESEQRPADVVTMLQEPLTEEAARRLSGKASEVIVAAVGVNCPDCRVMLGRLRDLLAELEESRNCEPGWR